MPQCALLAPAAPTMAAEGTPPEASVPLPCSVWLPQPLLILTILKCSPHVALYDMLCPPCGCKHD